jgi:hypothetical protein
MQSNMPIFNANPPYQEFCIYNYNNIIAWDKLQMLEFYILQVKNYICISLYIQVSLESN